MRLPDELIQLVLQFEAPGGRWSLLDVVVPRWLFRWAVFHTCAGATVLRRALLRHPTGAGLPAWIQEAIGDDHRTKWANVRALPPLSLFVREGATELLVDVLSDDEMDVYEAARMCVDAAAWGCLTSLVRGRAGHHAALRSWIAYYMIRSRGDVRHDHVAGDDVWLARRLVAHRHLPVNRRSYALLSCALVYFDEPFIARSLLFHVPRAVVAERIIAYKHIHSAVELADKLGAVGLAIATRPEHVHAVLHNIGVVTLDPLLYAFRNTAWPRVLDCVVPLLAV
jgi:hypothetical protein